MSHRERSTSASGGSYMRHGSTLSQHERAATAGPYSRPEASASAIREVYCRSLGSKLFKRYLQFGDEELLVKAIDLEREALFLCPRDDPDRGAFCRDLAVSLHKHFQHTGSQEKLLEAIELEREALVLCPPDHPKHAITCRRLWLSLKKRYDHTGNTELLYEALNLEREALSTCSSAHPKRAGYCKSLASSLFACYEQTGNRALLPEAIDLGWEALSLCPHDHADRAQLCRDLALSLYTRYEHTGDAELLIKAIDVGRESLSLCPRGHSKRAASCRHVAVLLHQRYNLTGDMQLLIEAIDLNREALSLCPPGHPDRVGPCRSLASSVYTRFKHTGNESLLIEALDLKQEALSLCPPGHPKRALCLRHLAVSLIEQFDLSGDEDLLISALSLQREAISIWPAGHPEHVYSRTNLAISLHKCYKHTGNDQFLAEILAFHQEGFPVEPRHMAWRHFTNLSLVYIQHNSSFFDISKSIRYLYQSLEHEVDDMRTALTVAMACIHEIWLCEYSHNLEHSSLSPIYQRLTSFLPTLVNPALETQAQLHALRHCSEVGPEAFVDAALAGNWGPGLEMMELTQGLLWSQRVHYRDPQLANVPSHLAEELESLIKSLSDSTLGLDASLEAIVNSALRDLRHNQSARVNALVRKIRKLPGLERFMLGESYDRLCTTASKHPVVVLVNACKYSYALVIAASPTQDGYNSSIIPLDVTRENIEELAIANGSSTRVYRGKGSSADTDDRARSRGLVASTLSSPWSRQMRFLWQRIVHPVLERLALQPSTGRARPRLYWCPSGIFSQLPLHAAGIYNGSRKVCCSDYVVSSYTPTLTILLRAQTKSIPLTRSSSSLAAVAEKQAQDPNMKVIPFVDLEIDNVVHAASANNVPTIHQIIGSTTMHGVSAALGAANIVHLACHGIQDGTDATQSGFCLSDGRLTIEKIMELKMNNPFLAFLSACETAKGDEDQPDQAMHLAAAMLFGGFKSVIATLWAIDDLDGPEVAKWFYEELFSNDLIDEDSVAYALDVAIGKLRYSGVHPHRWAPFIHMGA